MSRRTRVFKGSLLVDPAPLRDALRERQQAGEVTYGTVAKRCGYVCPRPDPRKREGYVRQDAPDTARLKRTLGFSDPGKRISADNARLICEAMGVDPVDVGL